MNACVNPTQSVRTFAGVPMAAWWSLAVKEVRTSWSAALLGCLMVGGFTLIGLTSRIFPDAAIFVIGVGIGGGIIFPLLVSMSVVAQERAEGSLATMLRLPMPAWGIFLVKTIVAVTVVVLPVLFATVIALSMAGYREVEPFRFWVLFATIAGLSIQVMLWPMCLGVGQPSEARVAMLGMAFWLAFFIILTLLDRVLPEPTFLSVLVWSPLGFIAMTRDFTLTVGEVAGVVGRQVLLLVIVWSFAAWRFGRLGKTKG